MGNHSRKTIGLLVTGVTDAYAEALCRGAAKAANNIRMNLVVVPGKYIDRDTSLLGPLKYEYQYTALYSFIKETNVDALIIAAGSIGAFSNESRLMDFLAKYVQIPIILVSSNYEGFRSISYDNESGIRAGLTYMIKELKCKNICMLGGPDGNTDVAERRNAFIKVMDEYGMELGEYSYIPGLLSGDNREACTTLIECNPEMDGVFCVNDYAALSLYEEMKARDLIPGVDIHIFGYDNTMEGAKADPPLATISADPVVLGEKAVSAVLRTMGGEMFTTEKLETHFVIRKSMGQEVNEDTFDGERLIHEMSSDQVFDMVFYRYRRSGQDTATTSVYSTWIHLVDCFSDLASISVSDDAIDDEIRSSYKRFIDSGALDYADINQLLSYMELLEKSANANKALDARERIYRLMREFYVDVARRMDTQVGSARDEKTDSVESIKQFVIESMAVHSDDVANYKATLRSLKHLGVHNAYMYMLKEPVKYSIGDKFETPDEFKLIAAMTDKEIKVVDADKVVSIDDVYDNDFMNSSPHKFVVVPLFVEEMAYGMLVCDLADPIYAYEEFLSSHISNIIGRMVYKAEK